MIHQTAIVGPGAEIGANVDIGPYCVIEDDVRIGDGCVLGPHVTVMRYTTLEAECRVHAGAVLGDLPQDTAFKPCRSNVHIGPRCVIREGVTIHRGTHPDTTTEIGKGCLLMAFSHCAHNVRLGSGVIMANGALLAGFVEVGANAFISGNAAVHQFVKIGRLAMLGGNCAVTKDLPPFCLVGAASLNGVRGLNVVGLRRAGLSDSDRAEIKRAYRLVFLSGLSSRVASERIRAECSESPALEMAEFIDGSTRGLCPAVGSRNKSGGRE